MPEITGTHPYADKFPMLPDAELDELAESIRTVGLLHPIIVDPAGLIIDGRNRLEACNRAAVEAHTEVYDGADIAEYVVACNVTRRNMKVGARAMSTALVYLADGRREDGRWQLKDLTEPGNRSFMVQVSWAGTVLDYKPDLADAVVSGELALDKAYEQAKAIKESAERDKIMAREKAKREKQEAAELAERNAQIIADLTQAGATVYLDMIDAEQMTPQSAWAAHREDTRKEREAAERERQIRTDKYTAICQSMLSAGTWGEQANGDVSALMDEYNPDELNPPQIARYLDIENLRHAKALVDGLIAWKESK